MSGHDTEVTVTACTTGPIQPHTERALRIACMGLIPACLDDYGLPSGQIRFIASPTKVAAETPTIILHVVIPATNAGPIFPTYLYGYLKLAVRRRISEQLVVLLDETHAIAEIPIRAPIQFAAEEALQQVISDIGLRAKRPRHRAESPIGSARIAAERQTAVTLRALPYRNTCCFTSETNV